MEASAINQNGHLFEKGGEGDQNFIRIFLLKLLEPKYYERGNL